MLRLLWVFCLCQAGFARGKAVLDEWKEPTPWQIWVFISVVILVLAIWTKRLFGMPYEENAKETAHRSPKELKNRLLQDFTEIEHDLVKLMTSVRRHKACLAMRHRGCWAAPILYKQGRASAEAQNDQGLRYMQCFPEALEQRIVLWLLSLVGLYGLAWLLDDFPMEPCPTWPGMEVMDGNMSSAPRPYLPRRGCSVRSTLKSLGQLEQNIVTLLYKLRKNKEALESGWLSDDQDSEIMQSSLAKDLVIYTIEDEA